MFFCQEGCGFIAPGSLVSMRIISSSGATALRWVDVQEPNSFGFCVVYDENVLDYIVKFLVPINAEEAEIQGDFTKYWMQGEKNAKKGCPECVPANRPKPSQVGVSEEEVHVIHEPQDLSNVPYLEMKKM